MDYVKNISYPFKSSIVADRQQFLISSLLDSLVEHKNKGSLNTFKKKSILRKLLFWMSLALFHMTELVANRYLIIFLQMFEEVCGLFDDERAKNEQYEEELEILKFYLYYRKLEVGFLYFRKNAHIVDEDGF